jgi:hypothetical protein
MMKRAFAFGRRLFLFGDQRWNRWERGLEGDFFALLLFAFLLPFLLWLELVEATDDFEAGGEVLIFAF